MSTLHRRRCHPIKEAENDKDAETLPALIEHLRRR
jgi:hypothetical protein